ncbi:MAG: hypothetical protein ACO29Z_04940 [Crocinitomicaceae bacterium]|jgi:hypothetical protein
MKASFFFIVGLIICSACSFALFSCAKDKVSPTNIDCTTTISYANDIVPLMQANCIGCHDQGNASGGYDFSSYTAVAANATAALGSMKSSGYQLMPQGGPALPDSTIQKLECWIAQGKLDN